MQITQQQQCRVMRFATAAGVSTSQECQTLSRRVGMSRETTSTLLRVNADFWKDAITA